MYFGTCSILVVWTPCHCTEDQLTVDHLSNDCQIFSSAVRISTFHKIMYLNTPTSSYINNNQSI